MSDSFLTRFKNLDWVLNTSVFFIILTGLITLLSSDLNLFYKQIAWVIISVILILFVSQINFRPFEHHPRIIFAFYSLIIILLVLTYFIATPIRGVRGWISFGSIKFQVSEFAKLALIILFSFFWARAHVGIGRIKNLFKSFIFFAIPAFLILIQPDLGTVIILFAIWFGYLLVSGIKWKHLTIAFIAFLVAFAIMWTSFLQPYQKNRIIGLFSPESDPLGVNYNVIQSKIAIGSAGILGKGFGQGTQTKLGFLPEAQTDFILAAFIEEWGVLGGFLLLSAFMIMLFRIIKIGMASDNNFSRFFCLGSTIMFLSHFILNTGSNLGLLPVIGVSFPFLSYGGSNLLTGALAIGIIQSIVLRNK
ncbi:rod shape-determining protein RodA [Patescibacteria group bacterium]|nr:rod shape-determining protein RodA [Patescibacteria group bacterium]